MRVPIFIYGIYIEKIFKILLKIKFTREAVTYDEASLGVID